MKGNEPAIQIYQTSKDYEKMRHLFFPGLGSTEYVSIDVSSDGNYFVGQGGAPDYNLVLWSHVEGLKYKPVGHICSSTPERDPVYQCSISPSNDIICVTGSGIFKLYQFDEGIIKPIQSGLGKRQNESYLAHCWITADRLIISNEHGDLFIVEHEDYKLLPCSPSDSLGIHCIIATENGFICGSEHGIVTIYEESKDEQELYRRVSTIQIDNDGLYEPEDLTITNFTYDEVHELLALTTVSGQLFYVNVSSSDLLRDSESIKISYLTMPFHLKTITGIDTCIRKPFIATCSLDGTVRVLDYHKSSLVVCQRFNTPCYSIAIHPSGLYCVVGFADKLKFLKILGTTLVEEKFFAVRKCEEVKFCHGGQYFAAVNGTIINIYNTFTLQPIHSLRGHTGKIRSLTWRDEDTNIISVGQDGSVLEFQLKYEKKVNDYQVKGCQMNSVATDEKYTYAVSNDAYIRIFDQSFQPDNEYSTGDSSITSLAITSPQKLLFGGQQNGSLRVYHLSSLDSFEEQIFCHDESVSRIVLNHYGNLLVSIGGSSMFVYEISVEGHQQLGDSRYTEEILISTQELQEKNEMISKLEQMFADLKSNNDYEQRKREIEFNERVKEQNTNFQSEMKQKITQLYAIREKKNKTERSKENLLTEQSAKAKTEKHKLEQKYNQKIAAAMNQIHQLKQEAENERQGLLSQSKSNEEQHNKDISQLRDDTNEELRHKQDEINSLEEERVLERDRHEEEMRQTAVDHQILVEKLTKKYQFELDKAKEETLKLSGENTIKENSEKAHEKEITKLMGKLKELEIKLQEYTIRLEEKQKETRKVMKENREREDMIVEKERQIFDLKKQNQELEKYKFVLDNEITTLNEEIKPSKDKIATLRQTMGSMDKKLKNYMQTNKRLKDKIDELRHTIDDNQQDISKKRFTLRDAQVYHKRILAQIHDIVQHIQSPAKLREEVKMFYQKHVNTKIQKNDLDFDVQKEYERQRLHLEKSVDQLKNKLVKVTQKSKTENSRIMHENVMLINEINQLRRESRILKSRLREKEDRVSQKVAMQVPSSAGDDLNQAVEMQKLEIGQLRTQLEQLEQDQRSVSSRPISRESLPPIH
eukprot:CAMPEP_0117419798 /NCGR_PEP_ID=MMETSP0758-20121206/1285_1 /TAXON_ID=63605 /ORGANISM="Percolomonas cosmopolitus, Strain AE-1 (ATCC 50343)" /LENGTH=1097 /DNA_ID=CAMNT_0005201073 /DNA_START=377 /DNA_END=3670 /DNA_ORIENTATION=+